MEPRQFEKKTQSELDDILNSALDELEDEDDFATMGMQGRDASTVPGGSVRKMEDEATEDIAKSMEKLLGQMDDPETLASLQAAMQHLGSHREGSEQIAVMAGKAGHDSSSTGSTTTSSSSTAAATAAKVPAAVESLYPPLEDQTDVDRTVLKTLEALSKASADMEGQDLGDVEGMGEDIMKQMMSEFEKLGEKEDYSEVMDNMMQQLLSREMMYDPLKQICDKYPEWLATHREALPEPDYLRYGAQYQSMQRVLAVYETEPDNFPRIMELMQDMQEHGQVPAEIVKGLAPGLEFNSEGMPLMGEGMMPTMPNGVNPMMAGVDPANCCIM